MPYEVLTPIGGVGKADFAFICEQVCPTHVNAPIVLACSIVNCNIGFVLVIGVWANFLVLPRDSKIRTP